MVLEKRGWRWFQIVGLPLITAAATIASSMLGADNLDAFKIGNDAARSGSPFWAWIADHRTVVIGVLVLVAVAPTVWSVISTNRIRNDARLDMMRRYLRLAKKRSFPDADGITSRARVSLFLPRYKGLKRELHCVYRTDGSAPRLAWLVNEKRGFVVRAWLEQTAHIVQELKNDDPQDLQRYLTESWSDEATLKERSWPGAAMIAVPITVRPGDDPVAVFLVETVGTELAQQVHEWDASMCCMLLEER